MAQNTGNTIIDAILAGQGVKERNRNRRLEQERFDLQRQDAGQQDILDALLADPATASSIIPEDQISQVVNQEGLESLLAEQEQQQQAAAAQAEQETTFERLDALGTAARFLKSGDDVNDPSTFARLMAQQSDAADKETLRKEGVKTTAVTTTTQAKVQAVTTKSERDITAAAVKQTGTLELERLKAELKSARTPQEKAAIDVELRAKEARIEADLSLAEKRRADISGEDDLKTVFKEDILPLIEDFRSLLAAGEKRGAVTSELVDFTESDAVTLAGQIFDAMIAVGFDTNDAKRIKDELDGDIQSRFKPTKDGKGSKFSALQQAGTGTTQATASTPKINVPGETKKKKKASSKTLSKEEFNKQMGF